MQIWSKLLFLAILCAISCNSNPAVKTTEELYDYDVEEKIKSLGIELSQPGAPVANYVSAVTTGHLVYLSGNGGRNESGQFIMGKLGEDLSIEEGYEIARKAGIAQLSVLKQHIGDLNKVVRIVKVNGMVNALPTFTQHPEVINGYSDLMVEVFGDRGKHARAAVGMVGLPRNMACEIDMIVEIQP